MSKGALATHQETEPFEDRIDILFKELELAIKWQRPSILLAVYNSRYVCADAVSALENRLIDLGQKVLHLQIKEENPNIVDLLSTVTDAENYTFFMDGLCRCNKTNGVAAYRELNLSREFFVSNKIRIVFWLTEKEATDLAHYAPDYWAFRHRVIEFVESPEPEQILVRALESAWQVVGEYTDTLEDTDEKIALRDALLTELPNSDESMGIRANLLLTLGILHWRKGSFDKAADLLNTGLNITIDMEDKWMQAACLNAIALVQTSQGRIDEAIASYQQAIQLTPDQIFPWNNLGNLYNKLDRNEEAIEAFQKAIQHNADDAVGWNGLGNVHFKLGRISAAVTAYQTAISLSPNFAYPWNGLGNIHFIAEQIDEAISAYQKSVELNPLYIDPWISLGKIFGKRGETQKSLQAFWNAVRIDPKNAEIWNALGNVYFYAESYDEAICSYNKAIESERDFEVSYSNLAMAYSRTGKFEEAVKLYQKSVELLSTKENSTSQMEESRLQSRQTDRPLIKTANPIEDLTNQPVDVAIREAIIEEPEMESDLIQTEVSAWIPVPVQPENDILPANDRVTTNLEPAGEAVLKAGPMAEENVVPTTVDEITEEFAARTKENPSKSNNEDVISGSAAPIEAETGPAEVEAYDAVIWNELGNLYMSSGDFNEAIAAYSKAIEYEPEFGLAYSNIALAYSIQGRQADAIWVYKKIIDLLGQSSETIRFWDISGKAALPVVQPEETVSEKAVDEQEEYLQLSLDAIYPNPRQPRQELDVDDLVTSVREHGIIQPLIVTPNGTPGMYILLAGHRRLEAARQAGLKKVPAVVREANDAKQFLQVALVENAQRVDLSPLELADAYHQLADEFGMTHDEIAEQVGKSRTVITNTLRLLKLSEKVKIALIEQRISESHARALLALSTTQAQNVALLYILKNNLSVRQTEELVRKTTGKSFQSADMPENSQADIDSKPSEIYIPTNADEMGNKKAYLLKRARAILMSNHPTGSQS